MDVLKMLAELRQERVAIEEAIITLERLTKGQGKRRGRPPAWMSANKDKAEAKAPATAPKRRGRPPKNPQPAE
jgi:hypothetical protein